MSAVPKRRRASEPTSPHTHLVRTCSLVYAAGVITMAVVEDCATQVKASLRPHRLSGTRRYGVRSLRLSLS